MKMGHLPPQFDERIEQAQENDKYKVPKGKEAEAEEEKDSMSEAQDDEENDSGSEGQDDDEEVLRVLGIHLGTTNSCVCIGAYGVVDNRCLREIIPNDQGNRVTPSWMGFTDSKRLVGEAAKNQAAVNSERTVFDIKRLIGRKFEDKEVQEVRKLVPYQNVNKDGKPYIQVKIKDGETKVFSPVEISAMIFTKMKEIAEAYSELEIKDAVVSIPAYFNDAQRQATKDAGFLAGLNVIKTIEEPYAVDFAYDLEEKGVAKNILVFHLGGGTCEVSVLYISDEEYKILSQNGDTNFGGNDFDERVVNHFIIIMKNKYGKDISKDKKAVSKLRAKCERAKRSLSSRDQVRIKSISLTEGVEEFSETLTRASFEELNKDLFEKILGFVERALDDASLKKKEIDVLALVGGSSWIPKVQQLLTNFFGGKEPLVGDPDFVAAHGAARCGIALLREARDLAAQENKNMEVDDLSKT